MKVIFLSIFLCLIYYIFFIKPIFYKKTIYVTRDKKNKKMLISSKDTDYSIEQSDFNYYNDINQEFNLRRQLYETVTGPDLEVIGEPLPQNLIYELDNQNVHDTFVQKDTQRIYNEFQREPLYVSEPDFSSLDPEILDIVHKIQKRNCYISNLDNNEYSILTNTWNKAQYNSNIKDNLILQLKDSLNENNELYCPTGVVTRIVSSLAIENPEQMPKDRGTVNTEVLAKFSKLQSENENLDKETIRELVLQDYPKETVKSIDSLIDTWIDHI